MKPLRAILAGLIALSLAALPVAAAEMRGSMASSGPSGHEAAQTECCPEASHCEKQTKHDCDGSGACAVKCSLIPAIALAAMDMAGPPPVRVNAVPVADRFKSTPEYPPLPPPRV